MTPTEYDQTPLEYQRALGVFARRTDAESAVVSLKANHFPWKSCQSLLRIVNYLMKWREWKSKRKLETLREKLQPLELSLEGHWGHLLDY